MTAQVGLKMLTSTFRQILRARQNYAHNQSTEENMKFLLQTKKLKGG